jgi:hypothetical protein
MLKGVIQFGLGALLVTLMVILLPKALAMVQTRLFHASGEEAEL